MSAGERTTCAIRSDQHAFCWGENSDGQLGDATFTSIAVPSEIAGSHLWKAVSVGVSHTCGIDNGDTAYCWGTDYSGEIGDGGVPAGANYPVEVATTIKFAQISAGLQYSCGVTVVGTAACWGSNTAGR